MSFISCKNSINKIESENQITELDLIQTEKVVFPKSIGVINDFGEIFTEPQYLELSKILGDYDNETQRQIVVVTINSITPYTNIQKYASDLANTWRVGAQEKNNGLLILLCNPIREIGISTGYGTELILTDEICKNTIDDIMIPEFKKGNYYEGIKKGIVDLIKEWN